MTRDLSTNIAIVLIGSIRYTVLDIATIGSGVARVYFGFLGN